MPVYDALSDYSGSIFFDFAADAGSYWQETAKTTPAGNGDPVGAIVGTGQGSSSADALRSASDANRPVYRSNYNSSGYPAFEFDGTNDLMLVDSTGAPSGTSASRFLLMAIDIGSTSGNRSVFSRASDIMSQIYFSSGTFYNQGPNIALGANVSTGRTIVAYMIEPTGVNPNLLSFGRMGMFQIKASHTPSASGNFSFGGFVTGVNHFQGGIHQILYGTLPAATTPIQFLQIANTLGEDWGIADDPIATGGGGASFPPIGPGGLVY
jgi:hypothetical protein